MTSLFYVISGMMFIVMSTFTFIPYWTRKTESFGVTIPQAIYERKDLKSMRKKYTIILLSVNLVLFLSWIVSSFYVSERALTYLFVIIIFVYLLLSFLIYLPFYYQMKRMKQRENWHETLEETVVVDTSFHDAKTTFSNWWFVIPFLGTIALIVYTFSIYEQIPEQLPMHTSFSGKVTYEEKSIGNALFLPLTQLFMIGIFLFINFIIKRSKQQLSAESPASSKRQNVLFRRWWSFYLIASSYVMVILLTFAQFTLFDEALKKYEDLVLLSGIGILFIGAIAISIITGQGGSRINVESQLGKTKIDRDDDKYWKFGQFYFNKNDPAIFIEKRFGIGWTNNWAHPISWFLIIGLLVVAIGIPLLVMYFL